MSAVQVRQASGHTTTYTVDAAKGGEEPQERLLVDLGAAENELTPRKKVVWDDKVVDNELLNKKSSKSMLLLFFWHLLSFFSLECRLCEEGFIINI